MVEIDHEDLVQGGLRSESDEHLDTDEDEEDEADEDDEDLAPSSLAEMAAGSSCANSNGISGYDFNHEGYFSQGYVGVGTTATDAACAAKCTANEGGVDC